MKASVIANEARSGGLDQKLLKLYGADRLQTQRERYASAAEEFVKLYGDTEATLFSVPGRSEISGNHTDHNHGCVLAAALDLDIIAVAAKTNGGIVRVKSKGFPEDVIDTAQLDPSAYENYGSAAIIAGICDGFAKRGLT